MRLFVAVAEFCPAEAAVEFYTLSEVVKAQREKWILDPVQLLFSP